jgi:hypothetical protein
MEMSDEKDAIEKDKVRYADELKKLKPEQFAAAREVVEAEARRRSASLADAAREADRKIMSMTDHELRQYISDCERERRNG